jgi:hypothetical protein
MVVALLGCGVLLAQTLAVARHVAVRDPNDNGGRLDIRIVRVSGRASAPRWKTSTFKGWTVKQIWDSGWFVVNLDTYGDGRIDYQALIGSNGRRLTGRLIRDRRGRRDRVVRRIPASHPNRRSAAFSVGLNNLRRRESGVYTWFAQTLFNSRRCRSLCIDRAPQGGRVTEPRPPDPTPTPTLPTPTP